METSGPEPYDPFDMKRTLRWTSAGAAALASVVVVASSIGATNFWNPVGWVAGAVSIGALVLSWFFQSREKNLQRRKASVAQQLREQIGDMERHIQERMKEWLDKNVITSLIRQIRRETTHSIKEWLILPRLSGHLRTRVAASSARSTGGSSLGAGPSSGSRRPLRESTRSRVILDRARSLSGLMRKAILHFAAK